MKKNLVKDLAWKSGLSVQKSGGQYDRFRGRLMFPIDEASGKIIGFTGRALTEEAEPKYLNSSESLVFKKSEAVYALSHAREAIKKAGAAVVVEGQMDCLTAHQFGFTNTVATSGTAVTIDYLRLLKRYSDTVVFAFDSDVAGQKAARSASELAFSIEMNPLLIRIPYGKDPDECIRYDTELWRSAIGAPRTAIEYFLDVALADPAPLTPLRKKTITQSLFPLLRVVKNAVEQAEYARVIATRLGISENAVMHDASHGTKQVEISNAVPKEAHEEAPDLERQCIGLLLAYPALAPELPPLQFDNKGLQSVYDDIKQTVSDKQSVERVMQKMPAQWQTRLNAIILETLRSHELLDETDVRTEIVDCLDRLTNKDREMRIASNARAIADAFSKGDKQEARQLLKSLQNDTIKQES